jgi:hypothetical protein
MNTHTHTHEHTHRRRCRACECGGHGEGGAPLLAGHCGAAEVAPPHTPSPPHPGMCKPGEMCGNVVKLVCDVQVFAHVYTYVQTWRDVRKCGEVCVYVWGICVFRVCLRTYVEMWGYVRNCGDVCFCMCSCLRFPPQLILSAQQCFDVYTESAAHGGAAFSFGAGPNVAPHLKSVPPSLCLLSLLSIFSLCVFSVCFPSFLCVCLCSSSFPLGFSSHVCVCVSLSLSRFVMASPPHSLSLHSGLKPFEWNPLLNGFRVRAD